MEQLSTLAELLPGERGTVRENRSSELLLQRLSELGFVPGAEVQCLFSSPAGDPGAYLIRGSTIALRREDASCILLEKEAQG